ncbi:MAG: hypothetical protein KBD25_03940 [Rickettsiaceae bacterium]|nr:hypothetical protein [Rickettsiaceae bacterium]
MNIFIVDQNPVIAAQSLIDRHVVKMPSECSIMLANAYSLEQLKDAPPRKDGKPRGRGYSHHGCTKWAVSTIDNFNWVLQHGLALCEEYTFRTGKTHFSAHFLNWCPQPNLSGGFTQPYLAMPNHLKDENYILAYRNYYSTKKFDKAGRWMYNWTTRQKPDWATL